MSDFRRRQYDNYGAPCSCLLCQEAEATHLRIVKVPPDEFNSKARWLHGAELKAWYAARDEAREKFQALKGKLSMPGSTGRGAA